MNKQLIVATLLICLVSLMVVGTARAQTTVTPGVNVGDDYWYTTSSYWTSSNASASIPQDLVTANQTLSFEVRISDTNDTYVTTFTAIYYTSGNPDAARGALNIQTGAVTDAGFPAIIGANLTAGDLIHPLGSDGITINQTVSMNGRPTNQIYISYYNQTDGVTSSADRYFDKQTGILVQETDSDVDDGTVSGSTSTSILTTTLRSSPWAPVTVPTPEFQPIFALPIFMGATLFAVIAIKKKWINLTGKIAQT